MTGELDAKEIFLQALRFDFSTQVLVAHASRTWSSGSGIQRTQADGGAHTELASGMRPPTMVAAMVTEAFCVELYLKTIYRMKGLRFPKPMVLINCLMDYQGHGNRTSAPDTWPR
jgi:hypothetical protein